MNITNGTIIRFNNDKHRDWVCIHHTNCDMAYRSKYNRNLKNHTGYYLFAAMWYEGDPFTDKPYGKCIEMLERGHFNNITIVGHLSDATDFQQFKDDGRLSKTEVAEYL